MNFIFIFICLTFNAFAWEADPKCEKGVPSGYVCCHEFCRGCEVCTTNYHIDSLCCGQTIQNTTDGRSCNNYEPPCIMDEPIKPQDDEDDSWNVNDEAIPHTKITYLHIFIFVPIITCLACCICFVCFCFGTTKPPVKYEYIIGKFD